MIAHLLPPQVHVFVRDWLSANNVLLRSRDGHVLVDTGYSRHAPLTLKLIASHRGLNGEPLARIVNTHCHSDHVGGNASLARTHGCPIALPAGEAPLIEAWDDKALLYEYADQHVDRFEAGEILHPGRTYRWGDLDWHALAAPGHDMSALVFFNAEHGTLISGDALWENGFGIVMPPDVDPAALPATRSTLEMLARLDVRVVIPGHGEPFANIPAALERAFTRLEAFEADPMRLARQSMRALLAFALLDKRRMALADLPDYVQRVGFYRDFNATFFRREPDDLAAWLVAELEKAGAARREGAFLVPAGGEAG